MNQRELEAFVTVAELGRMDLAARSLGYSQPAVSYQIKCLEQGLGVQLFIRNSTGATLTHFGMVLLPSVKAVLVLMKGITHAVSTSTADRDPAGRPREARRMGRQYVISSVDRPRA